MGNEIRLSSSEFKALASDTRTGIIRLLKERNHTLTEISKKLRMAAPTIKQHLGILEGADLIKELDEGRKWKYYQLTRKGRNIFAAEAPVNVLIVLGVSILALAGMFYSLLSMLGAKAVMAVGSRAPAFIGPAEDSANLPMAGAVEGAAKTGVEYEAASWVGQEAASWVGVQLEVIVLVIGIAAVGILAGYLVAKVR